MTIFYDASALAKRYIDEPDSERIWQFLAGHAAATSRLTEIEIASAIVRRSREGTVDAGEVEEILEKLQLDLLSLHVVELDPKITAQAIELLHRHQLRAGDAVQLASAMMLCSSLDRPMSFLTYDARLKNAAQAESLPLA